MHSGSTLVFNVRINVVASQNVANELAIARRNCSECKICIDNYFTLRESLRNVPSSHRELCGRNWAVYNQQLQSIYCIKTTQFQPEGRQTGIRGFKVTPIRSTNEIMPQLIVVRFEIIATEKESGTINWDSHEFVKKWCAISCVCSFVCVHGIVRWKRKRDQLYGNCKYCIKTQTAKCSECTAQNVAGMGAEAQ